MNFIIRRSKKNLIIEKKTNSNSTKLDKNNRFFYEYRRSNDKLIFEKKTDSYSTKLDKNNRFFYEYRRSNDKLIFELNNKYQFKKKPEVISTAGFKAEKDRTKIKKILKIKDKSEYKKNSYSFKKRILVIEDDRDMRDLVARHLEHSGFDVQKAEDAIIGQSLAIRDSPDLILVDLLLARVDGLTLCQRLRRDERTSNIPILMITALGGLKDKVTGFNSGADDYITKPFSPKELEEKIVKTLQ